MLSRNYFCLFFYWPFLTVSCHIIRLELGKESQLQTTECNQYSYFSVEVNHPCDSLSIKVNKIEGEPNAYVSKEPVKYPKYQSLAWSSYEWGSEELVISSWDPNFEVGTFYIGVHSYCGNDVPSGFQAAKYTVLAEQIPHTHPKTIDLFNKTISGVINPKEYNYYRFCLPSECFKVEVRLDNCIDPEVCPTTYAWPELIISKNVERPTEKSLAWLLAEYETRSIYLSGNHENPGHYYIGVFGWCTPDKFCNNPKTCGPCKFANNVAYNLSVIPTDLCEINGADTIYHDLLFQQLITFLLAPSLLLLF